MHLSNLQQVDLGRYEQVAPLQECRVLYEGLYGGVDKCWQVLQQLQSSVLVAWAPADTTVLQQIAAAFATHALSSETRSTLQIIIPHDPYPGCDSATAIKDLWWNALFQDKWKSIVKGVEFLKASNTVRAFS